MARLIARNKKWYGLALAFMMIVSMILPNVPLPRANAASVTVAGWDFTSATSLTANSGNAANNGVSPISVSDDRALSYTASNKTIYASGWQVGRYWQAKIDATGFASLTLTSSHMGSGTGPKDFKVQYSTDGINFADVTDGSYTVAASLAVGPNNLALPADLDNQPNVYIRWLNYTAVSIGGATVGSGGTSRIANVIVSGTPISGGVASTAVDGSKIRFDAGSITGLSGASAAGANISVYGDPGVAALVYGASQADGAFQLSFDSAALQSVYVTQTEPGKTESAATRIDLAVASATVDNAKVTYVVDNGGNGTVTASAGAAAANANVSAYADAAKTLPLAGTLSDATGAFSLNVNGGAPDSIYLTQQTSGMNGRMLESAPVAIAKQEQPASDVTPISTLREVDGDGAPVKANQSFTVEGVVTFENGKLGTQSSNFYIQDGTAGINVFGTTNHGLTISRGDKIKVTGTVTNYNGLIELVTASVEKTGTGMPLPAPKSVTIADLSSFATAEPLDGFLAVLTGKVTNIPGTSGNQNVTIVDENTNKTLTLRVMGATGINLAADLQLNKSYMFTGVVGQFDSSSPYTTGYQLFPRDKNDIAPLLSLSHTPFQQVYKDTDVTFTANASGATSVKLYYKAASDATYTAVDMATADQTAYSVTLPATSVPSAGFQYYIEALQGTSSQKAGPYTVSVIDDKTGPAFHTEDPVIGSQVESFRPKISVIAEDPSGVDAASVQLWLNGTEVSASSSFADGVVSYTPGEDLPLGSYTVKVSAKDNSAAHNANTYTWTFTVVPRFIGGTHYYGTTHNHTNISHDAAGNPEDALKAAKFYGYDWFAFSDHSHDIDSSVRGTDSVTHDGMPERTGGSNWKLTKDLAAQYTQNGSFVVFPAFEMTSTTWGHSNVFGTDNFIDRMQDGGKYQNLQNYYAWVLTYDNVVAQFNHPDMSANAFDNFIPYNKDVDRLFTMLEVGNGSGKYSYANAESKFFNALDLGWHVAPTYGEDNHDATWGQTKKRTVIVAKDLSQESLLDSMRKMRVYMTEDPNAKLDVTASGWYMGSTTDTKNLQFTVTGSDPVLEKASDPKYAYLKTASNDNIAKVELISNGGRVIDSYTPVSDSTSFNWTPDVNVIGGQQWFVVRVTQKDGDRVYSSPIWSPAEAISLQVSDVAPADGALVGGVSAKLDAVVANLGTVAVSNITAHFYYDDISHPIGDALISKLEPTKSVTASVTWKSPVVGTHKIVIVLESSSVNLGTNRFEESFTIKAPLGKTIMIDASKKNENTTKDAGSYPDNLKLFTTMMKQEGYTVVENTSEITDSALNGVHVLYITHPSTAYGDSEIAAMKSFVARGGSLLLTEKSNFGASNQNLNKVLSGVGSSIFVNNDGIYDESVDGNFFGDRLKYNYAVKAHPTPVSNQLTDFVSTIESFSGSSLAKNDGAGNKTALTDSDSVTVLVRGNETTFQDSPTVKADTWRYNVQTSKAPAGPPLDNVTGGSAIPMVASETVGPNGGRVIVSGMNIFNDKQMDQSYNPKGNDPLALNAVNWLAHLEPKVVSIAEARQLPEGTPIVVQGKVTTAAGVFYDAAYVQDETGGIMAFSEVPAGSLQLGDTVRVYGQVHIFENDLELQFDKFENSVVKVGSGTPVEPKNVSTSESVSETYQGQLVKVTGKVTALPDSSSYLVNDGSGDVLVFVDGYIANQSGPVPELHVGDTLEAVGLSGKFSQGSRIRVRDTKELKVIDSTPPVTTIKIDGEAHDGWYSSGVTVTLTATDSGSGGAAKTEFRWADDQAWQAYQEPITLAKDGEYALQFRSTDKIGNTEETQVQTLRIDRTAPTFAVMANGAPFAEGQTFTDDKVIAFLLTAEDKWSGVAGKTLTLDGKTIPSGTKVDLAGQSGKHVLGVTVADQAGNEAEAKINFTVTTSLASLKNLIDRFTSDNRLKAPLTVQLSNDLDQAEHQYSKGSSKQAAKFMDDFLKHLNNKAQQDKVTLEAKGILEADATELRDNWSK